MGNIKRKHSSSFKARVALDLIKKKESIAVIYHLCSRSVRLVLFSGYHRLVFALRHQLEIIVLFGNRFLHSQFERSTGHCHT